MITMPDKETELDPVIKVVIGIGIAVAIYVFWRVM